MYVMMVSLVDFHSFFFISIWSFSCAGGIGVLAVKKQMQKKLLFVNEFANSFEIKTELFGSVVLHRKIMHTGF